MLKKLLESRARISVLLLAVLILVGSAGSSVKLANSQGCRTEVLQSGKPRVTSPDVGREELAELVAGNSAFAFSLYRSLQEKGGNIFYSPYSISLALAMTYAGARGESERQIAQTLHLTLSQDRLHPAFNALDLALARRAENYGAGMHLVDFASTPDECRVLINNWVSEQTEGKIQDLLPADSIKPDTRLVLPNAIYFKAAWRFPFDKNQTHEGQFQLLDGQRLIVPMMLQIGIQSYAEGKGYQAVELPYVRERFSMVVVLPAAGRFESFASSLDAKKIAAIVGDLKPQNVALTMPKFRYESSFTLKETLSVLGMPEAFSDRANFLGMTDTERLKINDVVHKAFVSVDEAGTEAAAASRVILSPVSLPVPVTIDHPFIFLIRDLEIGAVLFVGHVVDPSA